MSGSGHPTPPRGTTRVARTRRHALRFVVLVGIVSLFGDMTHEAAKGINGVFLGDLGASAVVVAAVSGFGELGGYLVRLWSGPAASRSGRYWTWTVVGYLVNVLAVPALALAGTWPVAAVLIVVERVGKGLRNPPRDAMLSFAGSVIGQGWAFALREALDQTGAMIGPLAIGLALLARPGDLRLAYTWLLVPAVLAPAVLAVARWHFPAPESLEDAPRADAGGGDRFPRALRGYLIGMSLTAIGYVDFGLVAFHLVRVGEPVGSVPLLYAGAMGVAGLSALVVGRWFDRAGLRAVFAAALVSTAATPLLFLGGLAAAAIGVVAWGIGLGVQDSVMTAPLAASVAPADRSRASGIFSAVYGTAWFLGSTGLGALYDLSVPLMVVASVAAQLAGAAVLAGLTRAGAMAPADRPRPSTDGREGVS